MSLTSDEPADESAPLEEFRWRQSRENLLSPAGVRMFQLAYAHRDELYESARQQIDNEYTRLSPRLAARGGENNRHGGSFINFITLLEELGLMYRSAEPAGTYLRSTVAGDQIAIVLQRAPDLLKVVPYFLTDILARYALNNPFNTMKKNTALREKVRESDLFPYWTLYRIMRALEGRITKDELRRFVFKIHKSSEIEPTIEAIKAFRADATKLSSEELDRKYGMALEGAAGQSKYIMGRAGYQSGVIDQDGDTYSLNPGFLPLIDEILANQPVFDELDENTWVATYGGSVDTEPVAGSLARPVSDESEAIIVKSSLPQNDPVLQEARSILFEDQLGGVLLTGVPGTGKSWYAREIALALAGGRIDRIREIQFHPSYQYEDFVEGYRATGVGTFEVKNKHLLEMCELARATLEPTFIVIDEFSRSDPIRVMGEALTYMETSRRNQPFYLASGRRASIPKNLFFIATMNPEDRSVDEMDAAMERRWAKIELTPSTAKVADFLRENGVSRAEVAPIISFFRDIQEFTSVGHAYFRQVRGAAGLGRLWATQLLPLIKKQNKYTPEIVERAHLRFDQLKADLSSAISPQASAEIDPAQN